MEIDQEFDTEFRQKLSLLATQRAGMTKFYQEFSAMFLRAFPTVALAMEAMPVVKRTIAESILSPEELAVYADDGKEGEDGASTVSRLHKHAHQKKVNNIWTKILKAAYDQVMSLLFCVSIFVFIENAPHCFISHYSPPWKTFELPFWSK